MSFPVSNEWVKRFGSVSAPHGGNETYYTTLRCHRWSCLVLLQSQLVFELYRCYYMKLGTYFSNDLEFKHTHIERKRERERERRSKFVFFPFRRETPRSNVSARLAAANFGPKFGRLGSLIHTNYIEFSFNISLPQILVL